MRLSLWIASLWPGFSRLWVLGRWEGLALAAAFAAALNTALVATLIWSEAGSTSVRAVAAGAWVLVLGFWAVGLAWLGHDRPQAAAGPASGEAEDDLLLAEAQQQYLKGHWLEAETIVGQLLKKRRNDVEARLLLASIQRRSGRWNEASRTLVQLRDAPAAAKWLLEIERELIQIEERQTMRDSETGRAKEAGRAKAA